MERSPSVRRFEFRLRLLVAVRRAFRLIDASDVFTALALAAIGAGIALVFGVGWGLFAAGLVLATMTPIGAAVRLLVRGR